jgi:proline iminopeptidase
MHFWALGVLLITGRIGLAGADLNHQTVARDGFQLHFTIVGAGRPLVILSGGPGFDADYMMPVARELGREYRCILLEQPSRIAKPFQRPAWM